MTVRLAMIIGGLVNIPVKRIAHEWVVRVHPLAIFGLDGLWPEMRRERRETIIAVNFGGCDVPTGLALCELLQLAAQDTPIRSAGGYRLYDTADVRRLAFIRRARELGFTLDEVRALLALSANDAQNACAEVRELAASHLAEVRAKIADLRAMELVLTVAARRCAAGQLAGCPIIDALSVE